MDATKIALSISHAGASYVRGTYDGLFDAGRLIADKARVNASMDTHGKNYMRGTNATKHKMLRVQVRKFRIVGQQAVAVTTTPKAHWAWLESGTKAHWVGAGKGEARLSVYSRSDSRKTFAIHELKSRKKNGGTRQVIQSRFPHMEVAQGKWRTGPWYVGGAQPKHTFSRATDNVDVAQIVNNRQLKALGGSVIGRRR